MAEKRRELEKAKDCLAKMCQLRGEPGETPTTMMIRLKQGELRPAVVDPALVDPNFNQAFQAAEEKRKEQEAAGESDSGESCFGGGLDHSGETPRVGAHQTVATTPGSPSPPPFRGEAAPTDANPILRAMELSPVISVGREVEDTAADPGENDGTVIKGKGSTGEPKTSTPDSTVQQGDNPSPPAGSGTPDSLQGEDEEESARIKEAKNRFRREMNDLKRLRLKRQEEKRKAEEEAAAEERRKEKEAEELREAKEAAEKAEKLRIQQEEEKRKVQEAAERAKGGGGGPAGEREGGVESRRVTETDTEPTRSRGRPPTTTKGGGGGETGGTKGDSRAR